MQSEPTDSIKGSGQGSYSENSFSHTNTEIWERRSNTITFRRVTSFQLSISVIRWITNKPFVRIDPHRAIGLWEWSSISVTVKNQEFIGVQSNIFIRLPEMHLETTWEWIGITQERMGSRPCAVYALPLIELPLIEVDTLQSYAEGTHWTQCHEHWGKSRPGNFHHPKSFDFIFIEGKFLNFRKKNSDLEIAETFENTITDAPIRFRNLRLKK